MPDTDKSLIQLFADDAILYRQIKLAADCGVLQKDLTNLEEWPYKWLMSFHATKCEVMRFTQCRSPIKSAYVLKDTTLMTAHFTKYLGVHLT